MAGIVEGAYTVTWRDPQGRARQAVFNTPGGVDRWQARHPEAREVQTCGPERSTP